eukprot:SAG11_NODE_676_length_7798_cov_33.772438_5_plen_200_part_00
MIHVLEDILHHHHHRAAADRGRTISTRFQYITTSRMGTRSRIKTLRRIRPQWEVRLRALPPVREDRLRALPTQRHAETFVVAHGLDFVPTRKPPTRDALRQDFATFSRRVFCHDYFACNNIPPKEDAPPPGRERSRIPNPAFHPVDFYRRARNAHKRMVELSTELKTFCARRTKWVRFLKGTGSARTAQVWEWRRRKGC